jgi:3',5'-cyclic AMP phosphodiesterase CpdA
MSLDRRTLLRAAAALPALTVSRRLFAAEGLPALRFVIVSDTHLGKGDSASPGRNWSRAIDEINGLPGEFVLHLGDVVDSGREPYYPQYAESRAKLKKPIHEIPGNHDPDDLFRKYVAAEIDRSFDSGSVRFVLLGNAHRDSHLGFVTSSQLAWLAEQFADAAKKDLRIVFCSHVPAHTNAHPDRGWHVKPADGQTGLYELIDKHADRVVALLHGHFHNGVRGWRDRGRIVEVVLPSLLYNQDRGWKQKGAPGFVLDEFRPGYTLATLGDGKLTLEYKVLGADVNGRYEADLGS